MFSHSSGKVNRSESRTSGLDEGGGSNAVVQRNWEGPSVKLEPMDQSVKLEAPGQNVKLEPMDQGVKLEAPGPSVKLEPMDQSVKLEAPGPSVKVKFLPESSAWPTDSSYEAPCTHDPARTPGAYSSKYGSMALFRDGNNHTVSAPSTSSHASGQGCSWYSSGTSILEAAVQDIRVAPPFAPVREANINEKDGKGFAPLHHAVFNYQQELLENLLQVDGVDVNIRDNKGWAPLHCAAHKINLRAINSLSKQGADIHARDNKGRTPLHYAAECCFASIKALLDGGANIHAKDNEGCTPLHVAASWNSKKEIEFLLEKGAAIDARDKGGRVPLHLAAENGHHEAVIALLNRKADVNIRDSIGFTPLHYAAIRYHVEVAGILLERGADIDAQDSLEKRTPLHYAARNDYPEMVKVLLERGADIVVDGKGHTPLHLARSCGHGEVVNLLQQAAMQGPNGNMNNVNVENLCGPGMGKSK